MENTKIKIGERSHKIENGFRVIGNDTSSRRPWMWYCPTMEAAQLLAKTICEETGEEVEICKYAGSVRLSAQPTEFIKADDYTLRGCAAPLESKRGCMRPAMSAPELRNESKAGSHDRLARLRTCITSAMIELLSLAQEYEAQGYEAMARETRAIADAQQQRLRMLPATQEPSDRISDGAKKTFMNTTNIQTTETRRSLHAVVSWLIVPTQPEPTWIPLGMPMEDFELLEATIALWKSRIVASPKEEPANENKISDGRSWRGLCAAAVLLVGMGAQTVTAEPVRSSALVSPLEENLRAENGRLKKLLKEAAILLSNHHEMAYQAEKEWGECSVCSYQHTQSYPNNIFGRIEKALRAESEKRANEKADRSEPASERVNEGAEK